MFLSTVLARHRLRRIKHIETFQMMGGWPMGMRFTGHTTCPHARAVIVQWPTQTKGCVVHRKWLKQPLVARVALAARNVQSAAPWQPTAPCKHTAPPCTPVTIATACGVTDHQHYCLRCWRTVSINHNADACAAMQQRACRTHGRPLAATQTPVATKPGGAPLCTQ